MTEKVNFETNVPAVLALAYDDGIEVQGRYGDQVMYTVRCEDGQERRLYVPTHVRIMLERAGIGKDTPFRIGKFEVKKGLRKGVEWKVQPLEPEEPATPAQQNGNPGSSDQRSDRSQSTRPAPPASPPRPVAQQPEPREIPPARQPATERPQTPIPFAGRQDGQYILSGLVNMIDICAAAEQYARAKGMEIRFAAEDIRALAITCYIQQARGGAR